ncbi:hypothetical protein [Serratia symbiotica]|uniref:hypothetical protein n=1 Tax=Serratia symbiotica TaxID=138074 RepID=UPI0030CBBC4A
MTATHHMLSTVAVQTVKPADKDYELPDGHSLMFSIMSTPIIAGINLFPSG